MAGRLTANGQMGFPSRPVSVDHQMGSGSWRANRRPDFETSRDALQFELASIRSRSGLAPWIGS